MKNTLKKITTVFLALFIFTSSISAMEWGGIFKNVTDFGFSNFIQKDPAGKQLDQSDAVYLWLNTPLNKDASIYLSAETAFTFDYFSNFEDVSNPKFIPDVDLLKLNGDVFVGSGVLSINGGRFPIDDFTSVIFSQLCDGLSLKYAWQSVEFDLFAGTTRLLNGNNVSMLNWDGTPYSAADSVYPLAHALFPVSLAVEFPSILGNQALSIQTLAVFDAGDADAEIEGKTRAYASAVMEGPITNILYYNVMTSFGTVAFANVMNYSSASLLIFPLDFMTIQVGADFASGDTAGAFKKFVGVTSHSVSNSALSPETSGVIVPKIILTLSGDKYYFGFTGKYVISCDETNPAGNGADITANFIYNIFSDLQAGLDAGLFIPTGDNKSEANGKITLSVSLSF